MKFSIIITLFLCFSSHAGIQVKEVRSNRLKTLELDPKNDSLLIFFGPNCSHCEVLAKELDCLKMKGLNFDLLTFARDDQLAHREKIKLKIKTPFYLSNLELEKKYRLNPSITPTLLFFGGGKIKKAFGSKKCEEIISYGKR